MAESRRLSWAVLWAVLFVFVLGVFVFYTRIESPHFSILSLSSGMSDRDVNTSERNWNSPERDLQMTETREKPKRSSLDSCSVTGLQSIEEYKKYIDKIEVHCRNLHVFGGPGSGRKFVCLDEKYKIKRNNCTCLSFGVNNEWSFEDAMARFGCKVYAFDPTMGKDDHQRSPNVRFFATGIANYNGQKLIGMGYDWAMRKVDRFENLVNMLGLNGREIDFVKLDVEISEIDFLQDLLFNSRLLLQRIKQLAIEVHQDFRSPKLGQTSTFEVFWPYFQLLKCQGFKITHTRGKRWREVVWVNDVTW